MAELLTKDEGGTAKLASIGSVKADLGCAARRIRSWTAVERNLYFVHRAAKNPNS
jgi:hypothetical protein